MTRKARIGLYLENEEIKRQIKMVAAKRGISTTAYCAQAIEDRLKRDGEVSGINEKKAFLSRIEKLKKEIGTVETAAELVKEGRRR